MLRQAVDMRYGMLIFVLPLLWWFACRFSLITVAACSRCPSGGMVTQHSAAQCSTAQRSTECGQATAQHRVWIGHSTAWHSTAQHSIAQGVNTFASTGSMLAHGMQLSSRESVLNCLTQQLVRIAFVVD